MIAQCPVKSKDLGVRSGEVVGVISSISRLVNLDYAINRAKSRFNYREVELHLPHFFTQHSVLGTAYSYCGKIIDGLRPVNNINAAFELFHA
ncbi:MAG: hypothetical protein V7K47_12025 [Nostoc sp.]